MNTTKIKAAVVKAFKISLLTGILFSPLVIKPSPAQAVGFAPASFPRSCDQVSYRLGWNRLPYIYATCKVSSGFYSKWNSNIALRGIHNVNGVLRQNLLTGNSSFSSTCRSISLRNESQLTADCVSTTIPGRLWGTRSVYRRSTITLAEITNSNGKLHYEDGEIIDRAANAIVAHAYNKHKGEYGNISNPKFKAMVVEIIKKPTAAKTLNRTSNGQTDAVRAYWSDKYKTIVIVQSDRLLDKSTAFKPKNGKAYYDNVR